MPDRSLDELEDRVTKDRDALAQSLESLSRTFAPHHLSETFEEYGNQMARTVTDHARSNPTALVLVGAGLAMLLSGAGRRSGADTLDAPVPPGGAGAIPARGAEARVGPVTGPGTASGHGGKSHGPSAARLRAAIDNGLDQLSPAARNRVRRARQRVVEAQESVERSAAKFARQSDTFVRQQPIAAGALAFGVGAIVAALVPGTKAEDRAMGGRRDALMAEASAAFERELDQARDEFRKRTGRTDGGTHDDPAAQQGGASGPAS